MKLDDYLTSKGRGALGELAKASAVHPPDLSRWAGGKRPTPEKAAVAIESATKGAVMRWDLRPDDWHLIWPELRKRKDAPAIKAEA